MKYKTKDNCCEVAMDHKASNANSQEPQLMNRKDASTGRIQEMFSYN